MFICLSFREVVYLGFSEGANLFEIQGYVGEHEVLGFYATSKWVGKYKYGVNTRLGMAL